MSDSGKPDTDGKPSVDKPDPNVVVDSILTEAFGDVKVSESDVGSENSDSNPITQLHSDDEDEVDGLKKKKPSDDYVDEEKLKIEEDGLSDSQLQDRLSDAQALKELGNEEFSSGAYRDSILSYTKALLVCPLRDKELRAVLYSNRSAAKAKLELKESAIDDCGLSLKHNPKYLKPLARRAKLYEDSDKLDEALEDYKKILELDPGNRDAGYAIQRLPAQINERNEKLKAEMMGKLKELGNLVLRPFGLSTENFQLQQDPNSGGYSINFKK